MVLVDYASSSDEEDVEKVLEADEDEQLKPPSEPVPTLPTPPTTQAAFTSRPSTLNDVASSSNVSIERLPDASLLLGSPFPSPDAVSLGGHSSIIAAARAENMSRKRESNGSAVSSIQNKYPRRNAPGQRNVLNAAGASLIPPQVSGRGNVVTEDIGRLFVNRRGNLPH